jgi:serine/threonine protein phosphatase 1
MATYACTDLHGRYDIYEKICKMLMPGDKVYFLGDANDRGPDGWKLIKAIINNPHFIYIKGNHEQMLVDAGRAILKDNLHSKSVRLLMQNGGYGTLCDWQQEEEKFQGDWLNYINKLPTYQVYQNVDGLIIFLSHAGCTPHVVGDELMVSPDLLWNRTHFREAWAKGCEDVITVHGHTPNCFIDEEINAKLDAEVALGAYWYCDNHKICLDTGAYWTDTAVLLDLDDFTEYIIQGEVENEE